MADGVKFVRIRGRIVPIKGKGSAPAGVSKRYGAKRDLPEGKSLGTVKGAFMGGAISAAIDSVARVTTRGFDAHVGGVGAHVTSKRFGFKRPTGKVAAVGALVGAAIGSITLYKKGKGESSAQMAKRASGYKPKKK